MWCAGEQHVGEDVGAELVDRARVGDRLGGAIGRGLTRGSGTRAIRRVGTRVRFRSRARARVHGGGAEGRARLSGGVADGARLLRQPVVDAVHEGGGTDVDELAHPVWSLGDRDGTVGAGVAVPFGDRTGLEAFGESLHRRSQARGGEVLGTSDRLGGKGEAGIGVLNRRAHVDDHARVAHEDPPLFERFEHRSEVLGEHDGIVDLPLHRPIGGAHRERQFRRDRAQVHLTLPRIRTQRRRTGCRDLTGLGEQTDLGGVHLRGLLTHRREPTNQIAITQTENEGVAERLHGHGLIRTHVR